LPVPPEAAVIDAWNVVELEARRRMDGVAVEYSPSRWLDGAELVDPGELGAVDGVDLVVRGHRLAHFSGP